MKIDFAYDETAGLIPDGEYLAYCKKCEDKTTKAGDGKYLRCDFVLREGAYTGRNIQAMFNYENPNAIAKGIGQRQLKQYCEAIHFDITQLNSTEQLEYKLCILTIATEKRKDQDEMQNVIKKFTRYSEDIAATKVKTPAEEFDESLTNGESPF